MSKSRSVYEIVTEQVLEHLEAGVAPWRKPWNATAGPRKLASGKPYRGVNVFLLVMAAQAAGYESPWWLSFKQAKERGGSVRKGEKSTLVVFWKIIKRTITDEETGETVTKTMPILRYHRVFNLEQTDGVRLPKHATEAATANDSVYNVDAEKIVEGYIDGPTISENGEAAYYNPASDHVTVPAREAFHTEDDFYVSLFHELGHSTGHETRLSRDTKDYAFNDHTRGREELVAEMTAAFLGAVAGIESTMPNHAAYLASWKRVLKEDERAVVVAAGAAQRAADWILGQREYEEE